MYSGRQWNRETAKTWFLIFVDIGEMVCLRKQQAALRNIYLKALLKENKRCIQTNIR